MDGLLFAGLRLLYEVGRASATVAAFD